MIPTLRAPHFERTRRVATVHRHASLGTAVPWFLLPPAALLLAPAAWPAWARMWLLAGSIFAACKWLTWRHAQRRGVPVWRQVGYLLAWPGLDADAFLSGAPPANPRPREWLRGALGCATGAALFAAAASLAATDHAYAAGWLGMAAIVLLLHFGLFHLLSCSWRSAGVDARPLMDRPLRSTSVGEFWGRRWNTAFRDLTHRLLFQPLRRSLGARGAVVAGFVFSGLVHDVVISLPAGGGCGGPTTYFAVQGAAALAERSRIGRQAGLGHGWRGWIFTTIVAAAPLYWLFHPPFIHAVVIPFVQAVTGR